MLLYYIYPLERGNKLFSSSQSRSHTGTTTHKSTKTKGTITKAASMDTMAELGESASENHQQKLKGGASTSSSIPSSRTNSGDASVSQSSTVDSASAKQSASESVSESVSDSVSTSDQGTMSSSVSVASS